MNKKINNELSPRQQEILALVTKGFTNKEIAALLDVSANTIKTHISTIFRLLEVSNRAEATSVYNELNNGYCGNRKLKLKIIAQTDTCIWLVDEVEQKLFLFNYFDICDSVDVVPDYLITVIKTDCGFIVRLSNVSKGTLILQESIVETSSITTNRIALELSNKAIENCIKVNEIHSETQGYLNFYNGLNCTINDISSNRLLSYKYFSIALKTIKDDSIVYAFAALCEYRNLVECTGVNNAEQAYENIFTYAKTALFKNKDCTWSHLVISIMHFINKDIELATTHSLHSIKANPANYMSLRFSAQMVALQGDFKQALSLIDRSLEVYPALHWQGLMMTAKALVYFALEDYELCALNCKRSHDYIDSSILNQLVWIVSLYITNQKNEMQVLIDNLPTFELQELNILLSRLPGVRIEQFTKILNEVGALKHVSNSITHMGE